MKPIKMFGLAALAALMAMAFAGAGSAIAEETQLCKVDPGTTSPLKCPAGEATTSVHEVSVTKAKLVTSVLTTECDVLFASTSVGALAKPQIVIGHFTYTNCGSCEVTEQAGTSAELEVLKLGHELADVTYEFRIHVVCSGFIDCTYKGAGLLAHDLGPLLVTSSVTTPNGETRLEGQSMTKVAGGFLCAKTTTLSFLTTPLAATYIAG